MKVSKARAADNREAILGAAAAQIRAHGLEQTNVTDVARLAGLTHGALYSHFPSKEALAAEALACAFEECIQEFTGLPAAKFFQRYLSIQHRDHPEAGCPTAALVSEIARQPAHVQAAFHDGVERFINLTSESLKEAGTEHGHDRAVLMFCAMLGGLALSRATRAVDAAGSADILRAVSKQLRKLADD